MVVLWHYMGYLLQASAFWLVRVSPFWANFLFDGVHSFYSGRWLGLTCCSRLILWSLTEPLSGSGGAALPRCLHSYLSLGSRHWRAADEFHVGLLGVLQMPCLEHSVKLKSDLPLEPAQSRSSFLLTRRLHLDCGPRRSSKCYFLTAREVPRNSGSETAHRGARP